MEGIPDWWQTFRKQLSENKNSSKRPCIITGNLSEPIATVPPITGLYSVGGHARGDALICFDKNAFCSYGLKQAANAPVSESAINAVKATLDTLLEDAPSLAGMKFVHWYDTDSPKENDPVFTDDFFRLDGMETEEESEEIALMPLWLENGGNYYPKEFYASTARLPFDKITIPVPIAYDSVLKKKYGDYMKMVRKGGGHDYPYYNKLNSIQSYYL